MTAVCHDCHVPRLLYVMINMCCDCYKLPMICGNCYMFDCLCMRQAIRREGFRKRRAALGLPPGDTDPYFDTMNDDEWQVFL